MRDIHAPRYESTVDACVGPMLHVIFPEEGSFKIAPHHKVRNEVASKPREGQSFIALRMEEWAAGTRPENGLGDDPGEKPSWVEFEETLRDRFMQQNDMDFKFNPEAHSTPRVSRGASTSWQDDTSPLSFDFLLAPPARVQSNASSLILSPPIDSTGKPDLMLDPLDCSSPSFGADARSSSEVEQCCSPHHRKGKNASKAFLDPGPSTPSAAQGVPGQLLLEVTQPSLMLSSPDFNHTMDPANPLTPQVSGFTSGAEALHSISIDSFARNVPARGHGHAPHGIPDFMVLRQDTYDVLLIVEDKLHDNPMHQLSRYSGLFPDSLDIWFLGCRVAKEPQGGLEFMLAERDRTKTAELKAYTTEGDVERVWYPWSSPHIHNKLREIARLNWKAADFNDKGKDPID